MKIRAAVLEEFAPAARRPGGRPGGPARRRGARPPGGLRRLPHRPLHRLRRRPVGLRAGGARPRGRRRRRGGRRRRRVAGAGRPRRHAVLAAVRRVRALRSDRTNLCLAIREQQNLGHLPDGTTRLSRDGEPIRHFMGTSTFAEATVMPEIALAKIDPEAPLDRACLFACGLSHRPRRGDAHREGAAGLARASSSAPGWSAWAPSPAAGCRAPSASSASTCRRSGWSSRAGQGATDVMAGGPDAVARDPRDDRRLRRRLHLRGDRQRRG